MCRVSAGAVEHLAIARVENLADLLLAARRPGLWTYAAAPGAAAYDRSDYRDGAVFVLGAEGRGLRPRVRAACDAAVAIPMRGRVESLNVSTAAAVLLFEAVRSAVPAELYIVDGDNVCHLRGPGEDYARARELLVAEIAGYMAQTGIDAVVVLDGTVRTSPSGARG